MGYIYCFSNPSMPGILKIGMTKRTPEERLKEANQSDTWRPPTEYVVELSIRVTDHVTAEREIHEALKSKRINANREFFKATVIDVMHHVEAFVEKPYVAQKQNPYASSKGPLPPNPYASKIPSNNPYASKIPSTNPYASKIPLTNPYATSSHCNHDTSFVHHVQFAHANE